MRYGDVSLKGLGWMMNFALCLRYSKCSVSLSTKKMTMFTQHGLMRSVATDSSTSPDALSPFSPLLPGDLPCLLSSLHEFPFCKTQHLPSLSTSDKLNCTSNNSELSLVLSSHLKPQTPTKENKWLFSSQHYRTQGQVQRKFWKK